MRQKIREILQTLNRSIFVGERYEKNIQNLLTESYICIFIGVTMGLFNLVKRDYATAIAPLLLFVAGSFDIYFLKVRRSRGFSLFLTYFTIVVVLTYCIVFVDNGFAFLWTLLVPLSIGYLYGVREGLTMVISQAHA